MSEWILITIFAALMQTVRTGLQKYLKPYLSSQAITWARYGFGLPFVIIYIIILVGAGLEIPALNAVFLTYCILAGIAQIYATVLLISLFSYRNFAVGTAYAKTEAIQTALLGIILFGEYITFGTMIAVIIGVVGVILISVIEGNIKWHSILKGTIQKPALVGIGSGGLFAIAALLVREASLSLDNDGPIMNAAFTLIVMVLMQTALLGAWMAYQNRHVFSDMLRHWKPSTLVGLTSVLGSIGWFTALAMTQAAHVKTVGQIELIFSILVTQNIFKEQINRFEILGMLLVGTSIILLLYTAN